MSIEIPGYKIIRAIGRGGMATVYLAEQEIFEREVALKVMSRALADDPSFGQRFFREAKIVSRLVHPNVVTVHDVGEHEGHYYLSMEYIDGGDLKAARKRLSFRQKITAIKDIAKALQYAATKGYVHRDIKPENIMFHLSDGRAVLTDFGIARAAEVELSVTQTGVAIGTPHYMSPEQAKGQNVDNRADLYSLGVVLYLMLTGRVPYDADSAVAIGIKHITDPIPLLPMELNDVQPIIDKVMAKDPQQRYQSAAALITALDNLDMEHIEKFADEYDRKHREREQEATEAVEHETPTLVSSRVKSLSKPAATPSANHPRIVANPPARSSTNGQPQSAETVPGEDYQEEIAATDFNEALNGEKERFTVIYENEGLAGLDSGGSGFFAWLIGILIIGTFGGSIYFYFNPDDWEKFAAQSQSVFQQSRERIEEWASREESPEVSAEKVPERNTEEQSTVEATPDSEVVRPIAEPLEPASTANSESEATPPQQPVPAERDGTETAGEGLVVSEREKLLEEAEPTEEELLAQALEEKRARVQSIEEAFSKDSAFLPELVAALRELLEFAPQDESSLQRLNELEASEKEKISQLISEHKFPAARKKLAQLKSLFSESDASDYQTLTARLERQQRIRTLLNEADRLFKAGNIIAPEGKNALAVYQRVLEIEKNNSAAKNGIRKASNYYLRQASQAYAEEDIETAEEKVKVALQVDWRNDEAEKLLEDIRNLQERLGKRDLLFLQAGQAINNGQFFEPARANAYHYYASILAEDPDNARAREGIENTMEEFSAWIWGLVADNKFTEAREALVAPLNLLPDEERIQSLASEVDAEIKERSLASQPGVTKLLISGTELNDLSTSQAETVAVDSSIFVIFGYENIATDTGSVEARLLDGAGNIELAKKTISVEGGDNTAKFKFDSPVGSFPSGSYTLVLSANGSILTSTVFAVE